MATLTNTNNKSIKGGSAMATLTNTVITGDNGMMNNNSPIAADVSHCNTSFTYYVVGYQERWEGRSVLKTFRNKENAEAYFNALQARKQEFVDELRKYPLNEEGLDIYINGNFKWGDIFNDIEDAIRYAMIEYVEAIKAGRDNDPRYDRYTHTDYYWEERTLSFAD